MEGQSDTGDAVQETGPDQKPPDPPVEEELKQWSADKDVPPADRCEEMRLCGDRPQPRRDTLFQAHVAVPGDDRHAQDVSQSDQDDIVQD